MLTGIVIAITKPRDSLADTLATHNTKLQAACELGWEPQPFITFADGTVATELTKKIEGKSPSTTQEQAYKDETSKVNALLDLFEIPKT